MADFDAHLPGYEGSYDADLEVTVEGDLFSLTLITRNPHYGGASGIGRWTLAELEQRSILDGHYPEVEAELRAWARRLIEARTRPSPDR